MTKIEKKVDTRNFFHFSKDDVDFIFVEEGRRTPFKKGWKYNLLVKVDENYYFIGKITYEKIRVTLKMKENAFLIMRKFNQTQINEFGSIFFDKKTMKKINEKTLGTLKGKQNKDE